MRVARSYKVAAAAAAVLLLAGGAAYSWVVFTRPPELALAAPIAGSPAPSPAPNDPLAQACRGPALPSHASTTIATGLWTIQPGSLAGYRAHEKFAQVPSPHVAVARTDRVAGWLLIGGSDASPRLETGCVAVELAGLRSVDVLPGFNTTDRDENARDFLRARENPFAIFQPYPSPVDPNIARGETLHVGLAGALEVGGVSRPATFSLSVRYANGQVSAAGSTTVDVTDFRIEVPQTAGGFVAVNPRINLEVSLVLLKS